MVWLGVVILIFCCLSGCARSQERSVTREEEAESLRYRRAAKRGDPRAQNSLGDMYKTGRRVAQDDSEAVSWYRQAAERGFAMAQFNLSTTTKVPMNAGILMV